MSFFWSFSCFPSFVGFPTSSIASLSRYGVLVVVHVDYFPMQDLKHTQRECILLIWKETSNQNYKYYLYMKSDDRVRMLRYKFYRRNRFIPSLSSATADTVARQEFGPDSISANEMRAKMVMRFFLVTRQSARLILGSFIRRCASVYMMEPPCCCVKQDTTRSLDYNIIGEPKSPPGQQTRIQTARGFWILFFDIS